MKRYSRVCLLECCTFGVPTYSTPILIVLGIPIQNGLIIIIISGLKDKESERN